MQLYDLLQFLSTLEQLQPFPSTLCPVIQIDNHLVSDLNQHYKKNKKNLPCLPPVVQILWNRQPNILQCTVIRNRASIESVFQMKATLSPVLRLNRESLGMRLNNTHGNDYLALVAKTVYTSRRSKDCLHQQLYTPYPNLLYNNFLPANNLDCFSSLVCRRSSIQIVEIPFL